MKRKMKREDFVAYKESIRFARKKNEEIARKFREENGINTVSRRRKTTEDSQDEITDTEQSN